MFISVVHFCLGQYLACFSAGYDGNDLMAVSLQTCLIVTAAVCVSSRILHTIESPERFRH